MTKSKPVARKRVPLPPQDFLMPIASWCTVCAKDLVIGELARWLDDGDPAAGYICADCVDEATP
jgi:hypothetical protein